MLLNLTKQVFGDLQCALQGSPHSDFSGAEHDFRFTDTHHIKANRWQELVASGQPPKRKSERDLYVGHVLVEIVKHLLQLESRIDLMFLDVQKNG